MEDTMWVCLYDAFLSIVHKDCKPDDDPGKLVELSVESAVVVSLRGADAEDQKQRRQSTGQ